MNSGVMTGCQWGPTFTLNRFNSTQQLHSQKGCSQCFWIAHGQIFSSITKYNSATGPKYVGGTLFEKNKTKQKLNGPYAQQHRSPFRVWLTPVLIRQKIAVHFGCFTRPQSSSIRAVYCPDKIGTVLIFQASRKDVPMFRFWVDLKRMNNCVVFTSIVKNLSFFVTGYVGESSALIFNDNNNFSCLKGT